MRFLSKFYTRYGLYRLLKIFVKYSRLRNKLKKRKRVFRKRNKRLMRKINNSRSENLRNLSILFQSSIKRGLKKSSFRRFINIMTLLKYKYKENFIISYLNSLEKIRPLLNYKTMYISGKKYKIPVLMSVKKSYKVVVRWLLTNSKESNDLVLSFVNHINNSLKNEGSIVKYRREYHFQSFENKSYVRFLRFLKKGF
jgi:small subunit ribosomal protein S7